MTRLYREAGSDVVKMIVVGNRAGAIEALPKSLRATGRMDDGTEVAHERIAFHRSQPDAPPRGAVVSIDADVPPDGPWQFDDGEHVLLEIGSVYSRQHTLRVEK